MLALGGSFGSGVPIWAILFWGFFTAALIWLIAWIFLRQYFIDETGAAPVSGPDPKISAQRETQPVATELSFTEEPDPIDDLESSGASQPDAVDHDDGGAAEFSEALTDGRARIDNELGFVYLSAPEQVDDLKLIKGVGGVLEEKLHEFGVYHYQQIARWQQDVVNEFNDRLAFKGRIERDSWIDQARELHREKYGSS